MKSFDHTNKNLVRYSPEFLRALEVGLMNPAPAQVRHMWLPLLLLLLGFQLSWCILKLLAQCGLGLLITLAKSFRR